MRALLLCLLLIISLGSAQAKVEALTFSSPQKEALYKELIQELRCLVCQNQNLADSNAELATDLREQTYEKIEQGMTRDEIVDYMVTRYGDFVLYRPPLNNATMLLWIGPFAFMIFGVVGLLIIIKRRSKEDQGSEISEDNHARAAALLNTEEKNDS